MSEPTSPLPEPPDPLEPPLLPRLLKALGILVLAGLMIAGGWHAFRATKLSLALGRARQALLDKQLGMAEFWTGRALGVDQRNLDAMRLMAEINEAQDRPAALSWRMKVAQREPGNPNNTVEWAKCAVRFGQPDMALNALQKLPAAFKEKSADYHEVMAGCAFAAHDLALADWHFVKAVEIDHVYPVYWTNLAVFRLKNAPSPDARREAARALESALEDSRVKLFAARALVEDAVRMKDWERSKRFAEKLRSFPAHTFSDALLCLEAFITDPVAFHHHLDLIQARAGSDAHLITETGDWLTARGMAGETLSWFSRLPEAARSNVRVQIMAAEAHLALYDWNGLETFLTQRGWGADGDYLKRAMLIRCKREQAQPWEKEWKQLAAEVSANQPEGFLLAQMVIGWKWRDECIALLWGSVTSPNTGSKALQCLWDLYSQSRETSELLRVAKAQAEADPSNPSKKNNVAFLSLLVLGPSETSERLAREAAEENPKVPEWATTYALALHLAGKNSEARKIMEKLSPEALKRPGIAFYEAIILAANGDQARAKEIMAKVNTKGMLPEEQKLAEDLATKLGSTQQPSPH